MKKVNFFGREEDLKLKKESEEEKKMRIAWARDEEMEEKKNKERGETEEERKDRKNEERGETEKERKVRKKIEKEIRKRKALDVNDDRDFLPTKKKMKKNSNGL